MSANSKLCWREVAAGRESFATIDRFAGRLYPGSEHVDSLGLGATRDGAIWNYAKAHGFAIVSKDSDFADRSVMEGAPPKVIWICLGNCSTNDVERLLRSQYEAIRRFLEQDTEICLLLGRGHS